MSEARKIPKKSTSKREEKFQSPEPKANPPDSSLEQLHLKDLSPICPHYGSSNAPRYPHFTNSAGYELIQTPACSIQKPLYFDRIDEDLHQISGIINFNEANQKSEQSAGQQQKEVSYSSYEEQEIPPEPPRTQPKDAPQKDDEKLNEEAARQADQQSKKTQKKSPQAPAVIAGSIPNQKRIFCNCKKTKCLKLYCDCFRDNQICGEGCNCVGCHNLVGYEDERNNAMLSLMDRNPEAFKPKIDLAQHSKGCHCKKSNCQKKYCECFQAGLKCGTNCKCEQCKNVQDRPSEDPENAQGRKATAKKERRYHEWYPAV